MSSAYKLARIDSKWVLLAEGRPLIAFGTEIAALRARDEAETYSRKDLARPDSAADRKPTDPTT